MRILTGHTKPVRTLAYSPDGLRLASGSEEGRLIVWSLNNDRVLMNKHLHGDWLRAIAIANDNKRIVTASWDNTYREQKKRWKSFSLECGAWSLAISPDDWQYAIGLGNGQIHLHRQDGPTHRIEPESPRGPIVSMAFSPDGHQLITTGHHGQLKMWDAHWGQLLHECASDSRWTRGTCWSPGGKLIASGGDDTIVKLWDPESLTLIDELSAHKWPITALQFHDAGRRLLSASWDGTVIDWHVERRTPISTYNWELGRLHCLAVSPDSMTAAVGGDHCDVIVWDLEDE